MKKYGKSTKRGFTLVELIVVLVILAVLAAMLVPALTGYIRRAREEKEFQAASSVYTAVQALATEEYAKNGFKSTDDKNINVANIDKSKVEDLTDLTINDLYITVDGATVKTIGVQFKAGESWYTYNVGSSTWEAVGADKGYSTGNQIKALNTI